MAKEASYLRCSKLSSYVEFNKMVQSLAVHGNNKDAIQSMNHSQRKGTSAEYNFYQTLAIMLNQVINNPSPEVQRQELLMIYQWFSLNKPLTSNKVKPQATRPQLFLTKSRLPDSMSSRPHTAPAALNHGNTTPLVPPPTPLLSFTAQYITQSMRPCTVHTTADRKSKSVSDTSRSKPSSTVSSAPASFSSSDSQSVTVGDIYTNVSSVAADMTINRLMTTVSNYQIDYIDLIQSRQIPYPPLHSVNAEKYLEVNASKKLVTIRSERNSAKLKTQSLTRLETITENTNEEDILTEETAANPEIISTESETEQTKVPVVSIESKGEPIDQSNDLVLKRHQRIPHKVGVVTLSLPNQISSKPRKRQSPRKLLPVVAGFNAYSYRPKSVA